MSTLSSRATVYLDPTVHKAFRLKAVETSRSVSDLINDALLAELAADAEDLAAFEEGKNEPTISFDEFVKRLRRNGTI